MATPTFNYPKPKKEPSGMAEMIAKQAPVYLWNRAQEGDERARANYEKYYAPKPEGNDTGTGYVDTQGYTETQEPSSVFLSEAQDEAAETMGSSQAALGRTDLEDPNLLKRRSSLLIG